MTHTPLNQLTHEEEDFLRALLWEEGHLTKGPATHAAEEHGLSIIRCLEPANRLSSKLHGEALNRLRDGPCPPVVWPWPGKSGEEVLKILWDRLRRQEPIEQPAFTVAKAVGAGNASEITSGK